MAGACGLAAVAMLVSYTAKNPSGLALGLILFGGAQLAISLSTQVAILAQNREERRRVMVGWYFFALSVGQIVGPMVGSLLAADGTYRRAMMFAATSMILGLIISTVGPNSRSAPNGSRGSEVHGLPNLVQKTGSENSLIATLLAMFAAELTVSGWTAFFPLFLESGGSSIRQIGFYFTIRATAAAGVRPFIGPLSRRTHPRLLVVSVGVSIAVITALMFRIQNTYSLTGLAALLGVATGLIFPIAAVVVSDALPTRLLGVGIGVRQVTVRLGQLAGPLALGFMSSRWNLPTAFMVYAGVAASVGLSGALSHSSRKLVTKRI